MMTLRVRLVLVIAVLALLASLLLIAVGQNAATVRAAAIDAIHEQQNQQASRALQLLFEQTQQFLERTAQDPRVRDLIRSGAQPTVVRELSLAENSFGFDVVLLHDRSSNTLYLSDAPSRPGELYGIGDYLLQQYSDKPTKQGTEVLLRERAVLLLSETLRSEGQALGVVMAGLPLDATLAKTLETRTGLPFQFDASGDSAGEAVPWPVGVTSSHRLTLAPITNLPTETASLWWLGALAVLALGAAGAWWLWQDGIRDEQARAALLAAVQREAEGQRGSLAGLRPSPETASLQQTLLQWQQQSGNQQQQLESQLQRLRSQHDQLVEQTRHVLRERDVAVNAPRTKSEFLSRMGDEITTPMNSMMSMLHLLDQYRLPQEPRELLTIASRAARTLVDNLNNILEFSKLDAGLLKLNKQPVQVHPLVESVVNEFAHHATAKNLKLSHSINMDVPETTLADEARVKQILGNLVGNAVRFTKEGEVGVFVDVLEKDNRKRLRFSVSDTGQGIPKDAQAGLFDSLDSRSRLTNASFAGRLRLIVCKQLSELMGGEIGVSSEVGKGSRFWFTMALEPVARENSQENKTPA
ncbi:hypothetical protein HPT27_16025 [Permianibacter sp. IMCC34836]|uniref:sensor histidine kinase n=1 Tax=Permianibacter fluminis TaxID=2738515 RepID=UPI0015570B56|nr:ATP-binding protein [Permianibacter fluminis]NQD38531.1 hypothetical protein [Permianibacter fluminis]